MRAFLALVVHEINQRKALLAAAAVASLLPLAAPLLPATGSNPAEDIREAVLWVMVGGLVPLFALLLGVSFIGRDLAEGRLGFYYAQPLSGPTIWFGKLTAVLLLVWGSQLLIMLPTALLAPDPIRLLAPMPGNDPVGLRWCVTALLWLMPPTVVLLAHTFGIVWRARTPWLLVDLVSLLVVATLLWLTMSPFRNLMLYWVFIVGGWVAWVVACTGMTLAGAVQTAAGRVDLRRSHRALSLALWACVGLGAVALYGWSTWLRSPSPSDLAGIGEVSVGAGDWVAVTGRARGRLDLESRFLVNARDGRWIRIDPAVRWYVRWVVFSADGRVAVWGRKTSATELDIMTLSPDDDRPAPRFTGISVRSGRDIMPRLSADGARLAVVDHGAVAVFDLRSGRQLAATTLDDGHEPLDAWFRNLSEVEILAHEDANGRSRTYLLDVERRVLTRLGDSARPFPSLFVVPESGAVARRAFTSDGDRDRLVLADPDSGEVMADLGPWPGSSNVEIRRDGTILVCVGWPDPRVDVFDPRGTLVRRIELSPAGSARFAMVDRSDVVLVGMHVEDETGGDDHRRRTVAVDVETGEVETVLDGYSPLLGSWSVSHSPGADCEGSIARELVMSEDRSLYRWERETGVVVPVVPPAS